MLNVYIKRVRSQDSEEIILGIYYKLSIVFCVAEREITNTRGVATAGLKEWPDKTTLWHNLFLAKLIACDMIESGEIPE